MARLAITRKSRTTRAIKTVDDIEASTSRATRVIVPDFMLERVCVVEDLYQEQVLPGFVCFSKLVGSITRCSNGVSTVG